MIWVSGSNPLVHLLKSSKLVSLKLSSPPIITLPRTFKLLFILELPSTSNASVGLFVFIPTLLLIINLSLFTISLSLLIVKSPSITKSPFKNELFVTCKLLT